MKLQNKAYRRLNKEKMIIFQKFNHYKAMSGKAKSQSTRQPMGDAYTAKNTSMKTDNSIISQPQARDLTIAFLLLLLISVIWAIWLVFVTYPILSVWGQN